MAKGIENLEHESLASQHYGYTGSPEYGSWVNRRMYGASTDKKTDRMSYSSYMIHRNNNPSHRNILIQKNEWPTRNFYVSSNKPSSTFIIENNPSHPYRAYYNQFLENSRTANLPQ